MLPLSVTALPSCLAATGPSTSPILVFAAAALVAGVALFIFARRRTLAQRAMILLVAGLALGGATTLTLPASGAFAAGGCETAPGQTAPAPTPMPMPDAVPMTAAPVTFACNSTNVSIDLAGYIKPTVGTDGTAATITSVTFADGTTTETQGGIRGAITGTVFTLNYLAADTSGTWIFTYLATDSAGNTATSTITLTGATSGSCFSGGGNNGGHGNGGNGGGHGGGNGGGHNGGGNNGGNNGGGANATPPSAAPVDVACDSSDVSIDLAGYIVPTVNADGTAATITSITFASGATTDVQGGIEGDITDAVFTLNYLGADTAGTWTFTYTATDDAGGTASNTITLTGAGSEACFGGGNGGGGSGSNG